MYLIEKIIKLINGDKPKKSEPSILSNDEDTIEDVLTCNHTFMPIDSDGFILACSKCGYMTNRDILNGKNQ